MTAIVEIFMFIGNIAFLTAIVMAILFLIGYTPSVIRNPSPLGRTILNGKLALLLLAFSAIMRAFLHNTIVVDVIRLAAIIAVALWLIWDYLLLRRIQAEGKQLKWWRKWLPFNNYEKH